MNNALFKGTNIFFDTNANCNFVTLFLLLHYAKMIIIIHMVNMFFNINISDLSRLSAIHNCDCHLIHM